MLRWGRQVQRLLSLRDFLRPPAGGGEPLPPSAAGQASRALHAGSAALREYLALNNIADNPGASRTGKRLGRGIGSGKGKTAGRGHKGQKARTGRQVKIGFEGGQTPIKRYAPKRGFNNVNKKEYTPLNLHRLKERIDAGWLSAEGLISMRELRDSGTVQRRVRDGVKLLARGAENFDKVVHLQVSQASAAARQAVEQLGGSVTTVYYNPLGLRALLTPDWFERKGRRLPRPARPTPKKRARWDAIGALPPAANPPPLRAP